MEYLILTKMNDRISGFDTLLKFLRMKNNISHASYCTFGKHMESSKQVEDWYIT